MRVGSTCWEENSRREGLLEVLAGKKGEGFINQDKNVDFTLHKRENHLILMDEEIYLYYLI